MSSDADLIVTIQLALTNLYKFGGPLLISLGTVGNIISLIVFTKKNLRKSPCSIYFTAMNIANLLLLYTSILLTALGNDYSIDPSSSNRIVCHLFFYSLYLFDVLSPTYLIFASIDRILITSPNALTRQRSTRRLAFACIISITLLWSICHCHVFVFVGIVQLSPGYFLCFFQLGTYLTVTSYYTLIVKGILVPVSMITLGLWTVKNIRSVGRVAPVHDISAGSGLRSTRSKDRQLIRVLLVDISIYVIFTSMMSGILFYQQITQYQSKSLVQTRFDNFLLNIAGFSAYIPFCIGCYTNLLVSKTFRTEARNLLMCKWVHRH